MRHLLVMYGDWAPSPDHLARLAALAPEVRVQVADSDAAAKALAPEAEVILGHRYLRQALPHTRRLQWVQSTAAGVHHLWSPQLARLAPRLTRCPIFAETVAWHAFSLALAVQRRLPEAFAAQQRGEWAAPFDMLPLPRTALLLGTGFIGRALASRLRLNGVTVIGAARTPSAEIAAACDEVVPFARWRDYLPRADWLFITLPLTPSTAGLVDEAALAALPAHAVLVNVGRGGVVDQAALVRQLRAGHLGGAALDVLDPLPANADDPLWSTPRLLITPKVAAFQAERQAMLEDFMEAQVRRYLAGETPLYPVDLNQLIESDRAA